MKPTDKDIQELHCEIAEHILTNGDVMLLDTEDLELAQKYNWRSDEYPKTSYATVQKYLGNGKYTKLRFHRMIMNAPKGMHVDHINGNGLDNRKANLRVCTHSQNQQNRRKKSTSASSTYKGVCWSKFSNKWEATIGIDNKNKFLGRFDDELDAARAYNEAALELHGEFASLNEIAALPRIKEIVKDGSR